MNKNNKVLITFTQHPVNTSLNYHFYIFFNHQKAYQDFLQTFRRKILYRKNNFVDGKWKMSSVNVLGREIAARAPRVTYEWYDTHEQFFISCKTEVLNTFWIYRMQQSFGKAQYLPCKRLTKNMRWFENYFKVYRVLHNLSTNQSTSICFGFRLLFINYRR